MLNPKNMANKWQKMEINFSYLQIVKEISMLLDGK
jgi:hypothetical protein